MSAQSPRDHGGGLDAAAARWGGNRQDWLDLSTGINPLPYPVGDVSGNAWSALPDQGAAARLERAARSFWRVPTGAAVLAAPGASSLIARIPALAARGDVYIPGPTYNEHAAAFRQHGWTVTSDEAAPSTTASVVVHPNNPDGRLWRDSDLQTSKLQIIDESFADICPDKSLIARAAKPGTLVLKSFGKFWGLAGARLGFAIGDPDLIAELASFLGPWAVSGPALEIAQKALTDTDWAAQTRARLTQDAARLDQMMADAGVRCLGGTTLFRLYDADNAQALQDRLAAHHIWTRVFPYSQTWVRLGLPGPEQDWARLEAALA